MDPYKGKKAPIAVQVRVGYTYVALKILGLPPENSVQSPLAKAVLQFTSSCYLYYDDYTVWDLGNQQPLEPR